VVRGSSTDRADGARLLRNQILRGGQLGVFLYQASNALIEGNRIGGNNTEGFDMEWEAGGLKAVSVAGLRVTNNEVDNNGGAGVWSDVDSSNITYTGNRVHHNSGAGLFVEISRGARISGNVVWENGWGAPAWGWGAGILIAASSSTEVDQNTLAWNADGISVISQNRGGSHNNVTNVWVHDNTIVARHRTDHQYHNFALAWLQDWGGVLFNSGSNNRGNSNVYWYNATEGSNHRFSWNGGRRTLAEFNGTPGEEGGRYLSTAEKDQRLSAVGISTAP
jgi:parallel beta-helix repeat protein